jgi:transcriptional regulator with XRE-family HTH domain
LGYESAVSTIVGNLAETVVRTVIEARAILGWSQRRLARQAGVSQSLVSRFERGEPAAVTIPSTQRMFDALGIRADLRADLPVVHGERLQADLVHAWACGYVGRRLTGLGWDVRHEVEVGSGHYRGWIDVLGYRAMDRSLLVNEVKTDILDIGAIQRATSWYEREAWTAARRFGWRPVRIVVALLLLDSAEVEARLRTNRPLLDMSFPGRSAQLGRWIEQPGPAPPSRCLAMIDPAGRGQRWLRPSRIDGRRTRSRYENYADAAGRLAARAA